MANNKENELDKQDSAEVKNYTRTPNMLIFGYNNISPQEKWLYVCLKHMCGKRGTRHLSLRYISEQTGISVGALSRSKDKKGNINEGMIKHLHDAGLIHAEIKKLNGKGNPLYHITITDVWGLNQAFFTRPNSEQDESEENEPVRNSDVPVQNSDKLVRNSDKPVQISDEPVRKPLQYQDYIQDYKQDDNNTRKQDESNSDDTTKHTFVSSDTARALPGKTEAFIEKLREWRIEDEKMFTDEKAQGNDHAVPASGHSHRVDDAATCGDDTSHSAVDSGQVAPPEGRPVLEAQEITEGEHHASRVPTVPAANLAAPSERHVSRSGSDHSRDITHPDNGLPVVHAVGSATASGVGSREADIQRPVGKDGTAQVAETPTTHMPAQSLSLPQAEQAALGAKWNAQAMVAKAEELRGRQFSENARPKEMNAAGKLFKRKADLTQEDFEKAWKLWDTQWWHDNNGLFSLTDLAAVPKNKSEMRLIIALEKLERAKPSLFSVPTKQSTFVPRQSKIEVPDDFIQSAYSYR